MRTDISVPSRQKEIRMNELESKIQRRCQKILSDNGAFVFKTHGDIYMKKGIPDLVCCIPTDLETIHKLKDDGWFKDNQVGIFVGFEIKRKNLLGDVSDAQRIVGKQIENAGGIWYAVDDSDVVEAIVETLKGRL